MYILSLLELLIWISYLDILPEAICCLKTYTVNDVLLVIYRLSLSLVLIKASYGLYLCYLLIYCLRLFVVV